MLLVDGVKYELWTPQKEVEEFHPLVKEHYKEIFGEKSIFFEGSVLKSESGKSSVPDGFVVIFSDPPQLHIVEMELSFHELYGHIVDQVGRFINGIKNTVTQRKVVEALYHETTENKQRKVEFEEAIDSGEIYKFLSDIVSKSPVLTIIIEKRTQELEEAINLLRYSPIKIVEFQTFVREGVGLPVHAHLFEPLYKPMISIGAQPDVEDIPVGSIRIKFYSSYRDYEYIGIWKKHSELFPDEGMIELMTKDGVILKAEIGVTTSGTKALFGLGLKNWLTENPELKEGDSILITPIEPLKKYRFEILK